ncbi:MAG: hypothetical protein K2N28_02475 [Muribaculaceae bacterium]|nr:hypothetical protein [Muribaculaceae bacterium]
MKKAFALFLAFIIISVLAAGILYLFGYIILDREYFNNIGNLITNGLSCGVAGIVGPIAGNYIHRITSKKKN